MAFTGDQEASSSSMPGYPNRVFLSFRGVDTRLTFTGHLYRALMNAGINTFKDDIEITRGGKIKSELEKGIQQSSVSLIVFSEDYASSRWCLDELAMIIDRKRVSGHLVLPLFYHVNPTDVRRQTGIIGEAFAKYEEKVKTEAITEKDKLMDDIERWRAALKEAADISGMELKIEANGDESKFIQKVVDVVQSKFKPKLLDVDPYLVGMPSRMQAISSWIQDATTNACIMLICGMGGIGKTTIAKKVYNENYREFDGCSFLSDIRERSKDHKDVVDLQKQLLSDICNRKNEEIHSVDEGIYKIRDAICFKKVLLVLDDVDHADQLKAIFKMQDKLFCGSKIIVTSRNEHLKHAYRHCKVHEVGILSNDESVELFSLHAFGQGHPTESYMEHLKKIVSHCGGLPLALQVLGSSLYKKKIDIWESLFKKLDANPHSRIVEKLKISFDCLQDDDVKNVFLHIACFFVGKDKSCTIEILDACGMSAIHDIDNLVDVCLLKIDYSNKLRMHQLLKDMGRYIVRMESPDEPGERSRLWHSQDCFNVLREQTGTRKVKALAFHMQTYHRDNLAESIICGTNSKKRKFEEQSDWVKSAKQKVSNFLSWNFRGNKVRNSSPIGLDTDAFSRMQSLIFLKLSNVELSGSYTGFPKKLRWLSWHRCHLKCMPSDLSLQSLVCLEMQYSSLKQLWKGQKFLPALKILNLSHSSSFVSSPDFLEMPNLERLILEGCTQLAEVFESIEYADGLVLLNLRDCKILKKLPRNISMLKSLKILDISGCISLSEFQVDLRKLESLKLFDASRVDMSALASPAQGTSCWASFPQFIETLSLENCKLSNDSFPKDMSNLSSLKKLNLSGNLITSLPDCCGSLSNLIYLNLGGCSLLESVVGLPILLKRGLSEGNVESDREFLGGTHIEDYISWRDCPRLAEIEGCYKRVSIRDVGRGIIKKLGLMELDPSLLESDLFQDVEVEDKWGTLNTFLPLDKLPGGFQSLNSFNPFDSDSIKFCKMMSGELHVLEKRNNIQGLTVGIVYHERPAAVCEFDMYLVITISGQDRKTHLGYYSIEKSGVITRDGAVVWLWHFDFRKPLLQPGDLINLVIHCGYDSALLPTTGGIKVVCGKEEDDQEFDSSFPYSYMDTVFSFHGTTLAAQWATNCCPKCCGIKFPEGKIVDENTQRGIFTVCDCK